MELQKIVTQSKITLSRNVKDYPFPQNLRDNRASVIAGSVYESVSRSDSFELYRMSQISKEKRQILLQSGLITRRLLEGGEFSSAIINQDKSVSVMINEEDHVVEQCFMKDFNLDGAYEKIEKVDGLIAAKNKLCYHNRLGYLTSRPISAGTGMHASVTLFLPGLALTKNVQKCVSAVNRLGISMRSVENDGAGFTFAITNQKTLGVTEQEIIDLVKTATNHVAQAEIEARNLLKISSEVEIRDKAMRSVGILKSAYVLTESELLSLLSWAKLGVTYGWVQLDWDKLEECGAQLTDAGLSQTDAASGATPAERDVYRAQAVKSALN